MLNLLGDELFVVFFSVEEFNQLLSLSESRVASHFKGFYSFGS